MEEVIRRKKNEKENKGRWMRIGREQKARRREGRKRRFEREECGCGGKRKESLRRMR
jgi:hypothetical protein